jgi:formiminotetrahydrofolate cyclodeaminase
MVYGTCSCEDFVAALGTPSPVPGGGGAAALVGALGAALGNMVAGLTLGKKKYASVAAEMLALKDMAERLQGDLLALIQRDAEAFAPLAAAYRLPKNTEQEKAHKAQVMETALREACSVPLEVMRKCGDVIVLLETAAAKGNACALSDAGVGAAFCKAALVGAGLNVFINTQAMRDHTFAERINSMASALCAEYEVRADRILDDISKRLGKK